jgi:N-formylglutamate amidohydrolase
MTDQPSSSFITITGDPVSPWILHVPHSSTRIAGAVREWIVLDDDALDAELAAMTDAHTDLLARRISESVSGWRPWSFVNRLSRLVVDPERFPDEREVMNSVGMGAVTRARRPASGCAQTARRTGPSSSPRCSSPTVGR